MIETKDFSFIYRYFSAEKQESLLFLIIGIAAIVTAVYFYFFLSGHQAYFKGAAFPLLFIGFIQLAVGYTVYARSDKQRSTIAYCAGTDPQFVQGTEMPRMEKVMKNFVIYRYTEIALALAGLGLFFFFLNDPAMEFWKGLGMTLTIQAMVMLGADNFAEKRGKVYIKELSTFIHS